MNAESRERSLLEGLIYYLSTLWRYRWLVIGITGAAAAGIIALCVVSLLLPPEKNPLPNEYTASATILVRKGTANDLSASIRAALGITGSPSDPGTEFDNSAFLLMLLQSRTFMDRIIDEFDLVKRYRITEEVKTQSRKSLQSRLRLDNNKASGSIGISYRDWDPLFARNLTNRMIDLLSNWYSENQGSSNQQKKQLLDEKIKEVKAQVDKLEARRKELQKDYAALTPQDAGASEASDLAALRSQLILKEIDIKNLESVASPDDPKLAQLQQERQDISDLIDTVQKGMTETADSSGESRFVPEAQVAFNALTTELDVQKKIYNTLSHQSEVLKLTPEAEPPFQVMELAEVPDAKSGPQRARLVAEVVIAAFVVSAALALLLNGIARLGKRTPRPPHPAKSG